MVFSDWMTGYGMILIVDHGNGYMSLYAHNDALLREAGARVRRGEAVARVGNSGGQGVAALYFELRRNGHVVEAFGSERRVLVVERQRKAALRRFHHEIAAGAARDLLQLVRRERLCGFARFLGNRQWQRG